jgi:hypothetical protein
MTAYLRDNVGNQNGHASVKVSLKIRINQRQFGLQAATFIARIFGLKPLGFALVFYTLRFRTLFVRVLVLGAAVAPLSLSDSGFFSIAWRCKIAATTLMSPLQCRQGVNVIFTQSKTGRG